MDAEWNDAASPFAALKEMLGKQEPAAPAEHEGTLSPESMPSVLKAFLQENPDAFKGKSIMLFRGSPEWPDLIPFFAENFEALGLKKMTAVETSANGSGKLFLLCKDITGNGHIGFNDLEFNHIQQSGYDSAVVKQFRGQIDFVVGVPPAGQASKFAFWGSDAKEGFLAFGSAEELEALQQASMLSKGENGACWLRGGGTAPKPMPAPEPASMPEPAPEPEPAPAAEPGKLKQPKHEADKPEWKVYVLTNPVFHDSVKVGFTADLEADLKSFNAAVPAPYEVYCTCTVDRLLDDAQAGEIFASRIPELKEAGVGEGGFCQISFGDAAKALQSYAYEHGFPFSAAKPETKFVGCIYVLTNPLFSGPKKPGAPAGSGPFVKIGYTQNLKKRLKSLSTAVPFPYHVAYSCKVHERLADKDVHAIIDQLAPHLHVKSSAGTEFYETTADEAQAFLSVYQTQKNYSEVAVQRWPDDEQSAEYQYLLNQYAFDGSSKQLPAPSLSLSSWVKSMGGVKEHSIAAMSMLLNLRSAVCALPDVTAEELKWPPAVVFRRSGEECLAAVLLQDSVEIVAARGVPGWMPLPLEAKCHGSKFEAMNKEELEATLPAVLLAMGMASAPVQEEAPKSACPHP